MASQSHSNLADFLLLLEWWSGSSSSARSPRRCGDAGDAADLLLLRRRRLPEWWSGSSSAHSPQPSGAQPSLDQDRPQCQASRRLDLGSQLDLSSDSNQDLASHQDCDCRRQRLAAALPAPRFWRCFVAWTRGHSLYIS